MNKNNIFVFKYFLKIIILYLLNEKKVKTSINNIKCDICLIVFFLIIGVKFITKYDNCQI